MAAAASLWAVVVASLRRTTYFEREGISLWKVIAVYIIAGVLGGAVLGLAHPLTYHRWGAAGVGFVIGLMVYGVVGIAVVGFRPLALGVALLPAMLVGGGLGLVQFDENRR